MMITISRTGRLAWVMAGLAALAAHPRGAATVAQAAQTLAAQSPAQPAAKAPAQPAATRPGSKPTPKPAAPKELPATPEFMRLSKEASAAREANRLDEAIALYVKAVTVKPDWTEGWWYLGAMSYELDRYEQARDAFRRVLYRRDQDAAALALLGLSEYQLKDYDSSLSNLLRARALGIGRHKDLAPVVRYHAGIQLTRLAQYDQALQLLNEFAVEGNDNPRVVEAFGIAVLRMPMFPDEVPATKRELVMMAGRAQYFSAARLLPAARQSFEQLATRYPETPSVHYAYGVFLLAEEPDKGIEELQKELKLSPGDVWSMMQLAFEYLKRSDGEQARVWAEKAVTADPGNFVAHKGLGQALLEVGDTEGAIKHLERGVELAPDSPALRFQLAKAYQKAGRAADAQRERQEFVRLDRLVRTNRSGSQAVGGFEPGKDPSPNP
jgi:tetratricopeptide (TPR) repeat protein